MNLDEQYDKIYRYCYFKLKRRELAEDITQETFLRFFENNNYNDVGKTLHYLYTIARNLCIDEFRKCETEPLPDETADYCAEENLISSIALKTALAELSDEERELILLRYVNEVPVSVISKIFGISRFAVYRKTMGTLKLLREKIGKENYL